MNGTVLQRHPRPLQKLHRLFSGGDSLGEFLRQFPSPSHDQAIQALEEAKIPLLVIHANTNQMEDLILKVSAILKALAVIKPGELAFAL